MARAGILALADLRTDAAREELEQLYEDLELAALVRRSDPAGSQPLYQRALEIRRDTFGEDHPTVAVALRAERKGDPGRHKSLVGFVAPASKVPTIRPITVTTGISAFLSA